MSFESYCTHKDLSVRDNGQDQELPVSDKDKDFYVKRTA